MRDYATSSDAPDGRPLIADPSNASDTCDATLQSHSRASSDAAVDEKRTGKRGTFQAQLLVRLAQNAELFHTPDGIGYASIDVGGYRETWPLRSRAFRRHLQGEHYRRSGSVPSTQGLQDALDLLEARAVYDGPEQPVFIRVASCVNAVYLDLCNSEWEAIEVTADSWRVVTDPPVRFRRANGMLPLPHPIRGGSLEELRRCINVPTEEQWILCASWLVGALRPSGPYPILVVNGEQGSAKSTLSRMLVALTDPSTLPFRRPPRGERDLMIAANSAWALAYDNLSGVPGWLSDALCVLATGGGSSSRELYSDMEEARISAARPLILNGIDDIATRNDVADRALLLYLPPVAGEHRRTERQIWQGFEEARPRILGALLDAVSAALRNLGATELQSLPRMADFAQWVTAAEAALPWPSGRFLETYARSRRDTIAASLEADPVAMAVCQLMRSTSEWEGSATELQGELEAFVTERTLRSRNWPGSPSWLSNRLRRAATVLRGVGIHVDFLRAGGTGQRGIRVRLHDGVTGVTDVTEDMSDAGYHTAVWTGPRTNPTS
jgi:hypothetical protein